MAVSRAVIKRIGVLSLAKFYAVISMVIGLIYGLFFGTIWSMLGVVFPVPTFLVGLGVIGMVILFPIFFGFFGFLSGALFAILFNLVLRFTSGLEVDVEKK